MAELQNIGTSSVVTQIVLESSPAGEKYLQLMHFLKCDDMVFFIQRQAWQNYFAGAYSLSN
jgi:hypothetical protein